MHTDAFFWQLFQHLPETLFALLGQPALRAADYRFDSVEVKKSYRLDGLFVPTMPRLPVVFVEVQFQRVPEFYANLFAKVFSYLEANDPGQDWLAVALFASRSTEPKPQPAYADLLASPRVRRIYLDELTVPATATPGLMLLRLVTIPRAEAPALVAQLVRQARRGSDSVRAKRLIELVEELLMRRFTQLNREEVRRMFKLEDIRKSRVWQEAHEEGEELGIEKGKQEFIHRLLANGKSIKEIAEMLNMPLTEIRRLAKRSGLAK